MDQDKALATLYFSAGLGGLAALVGLTMIIFGWGGGFLAGFPLMLAGVGFPLWQAYREVQRREDRESRRKDRRPARGGIDISSRKRH